MRQGPAVGGALILALLVSACSSSSDQSRDGAETPRSSPASSRAAGSTSTSGAPDIGMRCPKLVADVPIDLDVRRTRRTDGINMPASTGVIWSNKDSTRVVNLSTTVSNEPFGDGAAVEPRAREVQGTTASEIVNGDVRAIRWRQPGATKPCTFWSVVVQGLSPRELNAVLDSVKEES